MKTWPAFDQNGDMPAGVYQATLAEVKFQFGVSTARRQLMAQRLERIYYLARGTGQLARFVVFGSFVTDKAAPNDVDIFMLMEDAFDWGQVTGEASIIFDHAAAQQVEGASVFWIRRMAALGGEEAAISDWQHTRTHTRRGIVEVVND